MLDLRMIREGKKSDPQQLLPSMVITLSNASVTRDSEDSDAQSQHPDCRHNSKEDRERDSQCGSTQLWIPGMDP